MCRGEKNGDEVLGSVLIRPSSLPRKEVKDYLVRCVIITLQYERYTSPFLMDIEICVNSRTFGLTGLVDSM